MVIRIFLFTIKPIFILFELICKTPVSNMRMIWASNLYQRFDSIQRNIKTTLEQLFLNTTTTTTTITTTTTAATTTATSVTTATTAATASAAAWLLLSLLLSLDLLFEVILWELDDPPRRLSSNELSRPAWHGHSHYFFHGCCWTLSYVCWVNLNYHCTKSKCHYPLRFTELSTHNRTNSSTSKSYVSTFSINVAHLSSRLFTDDVILVSELVNYDAWLEDVIDYLVLEK